MKTITKLWIGVGSLALLSPVGIILPDRFKAGSAWGEWGTEEWSGLVGYIPHGLEKLTALWSAPLPDYAVRGMERHPEIAYILSAVIGIALCAGAAYIFGKTISPGKPATGQDDHGEKSDRIS
jgi:hypothetical protein